MSKTDPFVALCEKLHLDIYKVAGVIHRSDNYHQLAKSLDIPRKDAESLWDVYWNDHSSS